MDKEFDLSTLSQKISDDFKAVDQARAYVAITAEHGPSQQLIDFINFDGKLGEEIGLEGWSDFSTTTQHEILLSKLNPDAMEAVAMEGFADFVKKYRYWLVGAGAVQKLFIGGLMWGPLIALGAAGIIMKRAETRATTLRDFSKNKSSIDKYTTILKTNVNNLPKGGDSGKWVSLKESVENSFGELDKEFDELAEDNYKKVQDGGWTPAEFISAAKWYDAAVKEVEYIQKRFHDDLEKIDADNIKDAKAINEGISAVFKAIKALHACLKLMKMDLDKVAKAYGRKTEEK